MKENMDWTFWTILVTILFIQSIDGVRIHIDDVHCNSDACKTGVYSSRMKRSTSSFNDPMYNLQWYLNYMNIKKAWEAGYTGKGVVISVVDTGLEKNHDEFKKRYDQKASYNFGENTQDPTPPDISINIINHGTQVGGIAAGEASNHKCGVGIAYDAKVGGLRFITADGSEKDDANQLKALAFKQDYIDIYACAWGPNDRFGSNVNPNIAASQIAEGTRTGRNNKGNIYVFAAGNEGLFNDSCTYDGYVSDINTFAITNINADGTPPVLSERCPGIAGTVYARDGAMGISNTSFPMPTATLGNSCTEIFSSSSAATAVATGIFALVLQANPNLTWRDLYHIIARTSQNGEQVAKQGRWLTNAAGYNGSFHQGSVIRFGDTAVSDRYGFGIFDAMAMINTAKTWKTVPKRTVCEKEFKVSESLPNKPSDELMKTISVTKQDCPIESLEHVVLVLSLTYSPRRNLEVQLTSPGKTRSFVLMSRKMDFYNKVVNMYPTMTLHNWGESPIGDWEVKFRNVRTTNATGELTYYKLVLYGTSTTSNTTTTTKPTTTTTTKPTTTAKPTNIVAKLTTTTTQATTIKPSSSYKIYIQ